MSPEAAVSQPAPLENLTLWQRVHERLREQILSGKLEPGAELAEVALSEQLGVSRGPIREALEMMAVRLAVPRLRQEDFEELQRLNETMARHAERDEVPQFFEANVAFHGRLLEASGNGKLQELYRQLLGQLGRYRLRSLTLRGNLQRSVAEHAALLRAAKRGDAERAAHLMGEHIRVPQRSLKALREDDLAAAAGGGA